MTTYDYVLSNELLNSCKDIPSLARKLSEAERTQAESSVPDTYQVALDGIKARLKTLCDFAEKNFHLLPADIQKYLRPASVEVLSSFQRDRVLDGEIKKHCSLFRESCTFYGMSLAEGNSRMKEVYLQRINSSSEYLQNNWHLLTKAEKDELSTVLRASKG